MESITMFFLGVMLVAFGARFFFSKRNIGVSPFDQYMMQKLKNTEFWNLQDEDTCEYRLRVSLDGKSRVSVQVYDYVNRTKYSYLVSQKDNLENNVRRLGYEKICIGKVGLP